jgi:hypothetical protein
MEVDSPPASRRTTEGDSPTEEPTKDPAQLIGALLASLNLADEQKNAWNRTRKLGTGQGKSDALESNAQTQDIIEIKADIEELSGVVQELAKKLGPKGLASYAQVLRQNTTSSALGGARRAARVAIRTIGRVKPVLLVHTRQLIVNLGSKTEA